MPCPFAQSNFNNIENGNDNEYDDYTKIIDGLPVPTITANGTDNHHKVVEEPLNYTNYLHTDILLSALKCLSHTNPSDNNSPHVHDEHFFILIHQVFELWFKQILFEIDSIRSIIANSDDITPFLFDINLRLNRTGKIWNMLIDQMQLLESMTPMEFLAFRDFITPASGFQSLQFRVIEMKFGLADQFRHSYKIKYFTKTMFKGKQADELKTVIKEYSLLHLIERYLEKIYDDMSFDFHDVFAAAVERMIDHEKQKKIENGTDEITAERDAETTKRQFEKMIDPNEYQSLLASSERRISQKAMLAALMISLYHQEPCFQQLYQMLGLLIDNDALMASWRFKHVLLVQRQIGRKPGTGGTGGFSYLQKTISDKYQVFTDLFNVSSYLIPLKFLPEFVGKSIPSITTIRSLTLQPHREVPIIRKQQPYMPKYQSIQDPVHYYQIPFFFLLFVIGFLLAIPLGGLA